MVSANDDSPSRRSEDRVPLAEARAEIRFQGKQIEASVVNVSNAGLAFWIPDDLALAIDAVPTVRLADDEFEFRIKWIEKDADRGYTIGGDRLDAESA